MTYNNIEHFDDNIIDETRQRQPLPPEMVKELTRLLPKSGVWNVLHRWLNQGQVIVDTGECLQEIDGKPCLVIPPGDDPLLERVQRTFTRHFAPHFYPPFTLLPFPTSPPDTPLDRLITYRAEVDGTGEGLEALHGEVDHYLKQGGVPPLRTAAQLRAYYRHLLEGPRRHREAWLTPQVIHHISREIDVLWAAGLITAEAMAGVFQVEDPGGPLWLPQGPPLPAGFVPWKENATPTDLATHLEAQLAKFPARAGAHVVGIIGAGGAGKTTLARELTHLWQEQGHSTLYLGADSFLWPGEGFRYRQVGAWRETWLKGPAIYDEEKLADTLATLRRGRPTTLPPDTKAGLPGRQTGRVERVVVEGVFVGHNHQVAEKLDVLVGVTPGGDERARYFAKTHRDQNPDSVRTIHLPTDFAEKIFHESQDAIQPVLAKCADLLWIPAAGRMMVRG